VDRAALSAHAAALHAREQCLLWDIEQHSGENLAIEICEDRIENCEV
jgi:hypothetical protein